MRHSPRSHHQVGLSFFEVQVILSASGAGGKERSRPTLKSMPVQHSAAGAQSYSQK